MDEQEQLQLTDFTDPMVQIALGMAVAADLLFIIIPIKYIFAVIVGVILYPRTRGFVTRLVFLIGLIAPLPLLTIATILAIILTNSFIRGVVTTVAVGVVTGGVGTLAEAGALAAKTAGQEVVSRGAAKAAEAVGGEKAGEIAGAAAGAAVSKGLAKGKGGAAAKTGAAGPAAQPPEMKGPQAQPEEPKSLTERLKSKAAQKAKETISEKLAQDIQESGQESSPESFEGLDTGPDVAETDDDDEAIDLRNVA
jgi:hypothetical protein